MGIARWFVAAVFVAVVVQDEQVAIAAEDEVVLGTKVPLTGTHQRSGADTKNGYELAIRQVNGQGGFFVNGKQYRLAARL